MNDDHAGDRGAFYAERDRRTSQVVQTEFLEGPVRIAVGEAAATEVWGQVAALAMVNMASRVHRSLHLQIPDVPLHVSGLGHARDLRAACIETARAIDPYVEIDTADFASSEIPSIGIGGAMRQPPRMFVGADGWLATLDGEPQALGRGDDGVMGGGLAAVLGAAALMKQVLGHSPVARRVSLWRFRDGAEADAGPREDDLGPLDVGSTLVVGAGAVASGLFYWLREVGVTGVWEVADGDHVQLHNTNRSLTFTASDAGWPEGVRTGDGLPKVDAVSRQSEVRRFVGWYEEWLALNGDGRPDLVIPLANGPGVRHLINERGENILVHATTSPMWTAQLHRHIAGQDQCIDCRFPMQVDPQFECAQAPLPIPAGVPDVESADAALPFLSAGAGLLLLAALRQLQAGVFDKEESNIWRMALELGPRFTLRSGSSVCRAGCLHVLSRSVRRLLNAGRRWEDVGRSA